MQPEVIRELREYSASKWPHSPHKEVPDLPERMNKIEMNENPKRYNYQELYGRKMQEFPEFMRRSANRIGNAAQYTDGIEGYFFTGADGSQMAFWTSYYDRDSKEHTHDYDEYFVVVQGEYTVIINGKEEPVGAGQEYYIPKSTPHSGRSVAGTRTIHCFGGKRIP